VGLCYSALQKLLPLPADPNTALRGGAPKTVGLELFTNYILPFELVGILLLVALIGALVMGRQPVGAGEGIASLKASDR